MKHSANSSQHRYDILGTTFTSSEDLVPSETILNSALSLLQDAEGNHCSSFPLPLLHLIQDGARLSEDLMFSQSGADCLAQEEQAHLLLRSARSFDPYEWAVDVQTRSPHPDLMMRTYIASAHRAATCIYLVRVLSTVPPSPETVQDLESLVLLVQKNLSNLSPNDPMIAATAWPSFVAGAETRSPLVKEWAWNQLQNIWTVQPWGIIKGALAVLTQIWAKSTSGQPGETTNLLVNTERRRNWITYLKESGANWLIV